MDTSKATPRPWVWDGPYQDEIGANFWQIGTTDFDEISATAYSEADASLIVRSVNAHEELVELLRRIDSESQAIACLPEHHVDHGKFGNQAKPGWTRVTYIFEARALLAKLDAEGTR